MLTPALSNTDLATFRQLEGKSLLITGASGVIGTSILDILTLLDNILNLKIRVVSTGRSKSPAERSKFKYISLDLENVDSIGNFEKFDYIIHGATYAQPSKFEGDSTALYNLNVSATRALKALAMESFLFISTSEVYSGGKVPSSESDPVHLSTGHPRAAYVYSKLLGEVVSLEDPFGLGKVARVALAYGRGFRSDDSRVLYDFFRKALTTNKIDILGPHNMSRAYIHALDCASDILAILLQTEERVVNVGGSSSLSVKELGETVGELCGVSVRISDGAEFANTNSPSHVLLDTSKIQRIRGDRKLISMKDGLVDLLTWIKNREIF